MATLALLACAMAPAFARLKPSSNAVQCLNNLRQLSLAWKMYADDSRGRLAPNMDGGAVGFSSGLPSWAGGWLDYSSSSDNTNTGLLVDHDRYPYAACLGPYLKTPTVFKCPSDKSTSSTSPRLPRVRTVSMSNRVGDVARSWTGGSAFLMYPTLASMVAPRPADLFVFVEEREDSINDPVFLVDPDSPWRMIDFPAAYHNAAGGFAFADAHAELHRWQDPRTMPQLRPGTLIPLVVSLTNDVDVQWIQEHSAARR